MHPDSRFAWADRDELLAFISDVSFAHIFAQSSAGPVVAHAPVVVTADGNLQFHLARRNRAVALLDGLTAAASIAGPNAYISPDWYGTDDQVPTWNYLAVEATGPVRCLTDDELVAQVDALSAVHEARLLPKLPWTRAKMSEGRFEAMTKAIVGFQLTVTSLSGTRKLGQNKSASERQGAIDALGTHPVAALMAGQ